MKKTQRKHTFLAVIIATVMLCNCLIIPNVHTVEAAGSKKLKVTCAKTVTVGKTIKMKTNVKATFKSSNKKIATVSSKGVIKGKKAGKVKITVTSKSNKKQKKVIKITVKKKQKSTVTTEKPTPNPKPTTEQPSVVKPTTEATTTEISTTEKATTEATTEKPTTEKKVVGIEANYRGSKVPNDLYMIDIFGADIRLVYSDGSKEEIVGNGNCSFDLVNTTSNIATYEVKYKEFSTRFSVELFDTNELYPYQLNVSYKGDTLERGAVPKLENLESEIIMNDAKTTIKVDQSKLEIILLKDITNTSKYMFAFVYDDIFTDEKGNKLFISTSTIEYIPHK